jgi:hypothetical protein
LRRVKIGIFEQGETKIWERERVEITFLKES